MKRQQALLLTERWSPAMNHETESSGDAVDSIVVENLYKTYGSIKAVDGVSFRVRQGEIFGLLGPNGAGKSTTVRILVTLTQADSGVATVAGHDVMKHPRLVRQQIGYVAQASGVDKYGTGRENLVLQAQMMRVPNHVRARRINELLEWVGLSDAADRLVRTYSGGMRRRLDIAMGLINEPEVLFLAAPTTGLDPESRAILWQDLRRVRNERNMTVLLTTHYLEEADQLCDRIAIVDHGKVVTEGTPAELKADIRGDTVTLDIDGRADGAPAILAELDSVLEVIPNGAGLLVRVANGAAAIPSLVTVLERSGIAVREVTMSRPSLDDVYLFHTGHHFSADGEEETTERARIR
jgi:ABC-2 type transport system ATP-binding protein